jgi:hypothetical protein
MARLPSRRSLTLNQSRLVLDGKPLVLVGEEVLVAAPLQTASRRRRVFSSPQEDAKMGMYMPYSIPFFLAQVQLSTDCRFPHVMPPEGAAAHTPFYPSRGSGPRPRGHANGNGFAAVDQKLANMSIQDVSICSSRIPYFSRVISQNGSSRSQSNDPGTRARGGPGGKGGPNAPATKRASMVKQRVPNADEFPVLGGSTTPPVRTPGMNGSLPNGNGHAGPTAAQILQAPRPVRSSSSSQAITPRGVTPERVKVCVLSPLEDNIFM